MNHSVTITAMLDEEDSTPVFEVRGANGNATNAVTIEDALEIAKRWTSPAMTLEEMARHWIVAHGSNVLDDMQDDVEAEFEIKFTADQWDSFCNMLEYSKITVVFPYGWGVPPTE